MIMRGQTMSRLKVLFCIVPLWVASATLAHGQEATERFVPIGQSPGESGKTTTLGNVQSVNAQARSMSVVAAGGGVVSIAWAERTLIWIDRSAQQLSVLNGTAADLQPGRRVEFRPEKANPGLAKWIKVEAGSAAK